MVDSAERAKLAELPRPSTASRRPAPRVGDLRRLEQKLTAETNYEIDFPRREPWGLLFEFPRDE